MPSILIDQDIQPTERLVLGLCDRFDVTVGVEYGPDALISALDGIDVLFATSRLKVTREVLDATDLTAVAKLGTGIDNVDLDAAAEYGVSVTYTPGINALSVAEHALGLALAVLRHTPMCGDILEAGGWRDETPIGTQLSGSTVGIVGFGSIGSRFAGLLEGFNVDMLAYDPYVEPEDGEILGVDFVGLDVLLTRADLVSVNAALTPETRGMLGPDEFALMKPSAVLVNTARGPVVKEDALLNALQSNTIAGAGLDVYEDEPLDPTSPLHEFDNVVLTPHVAARTAAAATACIDILIENIEALYDEKRVPDRYLAVAPPS